jgi:hypothetical protein
MTDWRGSKARIGDRVFCVSADATHEAAMHEARAEEVDQTRNLVRTAASPFGDVTSNGQGTADCRLRQRLGLRAGRPALTTSCRP